MTEQTLLSVNVLLAYTVYLIAVASPGPSNLAIMGVAMNAGRRSALVFALGVVSGSFFWALLALLGLSAMLASYSRLLWSIKLAGGLYLLWLAVKAARSALRTAPLRQMALEHQAASDRRLYLRGLGLHLTNPKAILAWLSIISVALPQGASTPVALLVVVGCMGLGVLVFGGYALAFSTPAARHFYTSVRRWFEAGLAIVFGVAGSRLLLVTGLKQNF